MTSNIAAKAKALPPGIYCPVLSLYKSTPRQEVDLEASDAYFSFLIRGGVTGLVLAGTTAEAALLSDQERIDLTATARQVTSRLGAHNFPLVAGISHQSTNGSIKLAKDAAEAGADFGLLLPPSYWSKAVTKDVILSFYREVADNSPIPIVIYNFPAVTAGIDLSSDVISELAQHPNIVAVKLTCGNVGKVVRLASEYNAEQFGVFGGSSDYLVPTLSGGGIGCVTGIGNVFPKSVSELYRLWTMGKHKEALELQKKIACAEKACKEGIAATKYGAWYFAGGKSDVTTKEAFSPRKPFLPAAASMEKFVVDAMIHLQAVEDSIPEKSFQKAKTNGV